MRHVLMVGSACFSLLGSAFAFADEIGAEPVYVPVSLEKLFQGPEERRPYIQANLAGGVTDFSSFGGSGLLEAALFGKDEDALFGAGGAIGLMCDYGDHRCRCELEAIGFRNNHYTVLGTDGFNFFQLPAKLQQTTLMGNLWYDRTLTDSLNLFVGGGLGGADLDMSIAAAGVTSYAGATNFAWQAGGGLTKKLNEDLEADLGYRYLDCGHVDAIIPGGNVATDLHSHEIMLCLRWYVW